MTENKTHFRKAFNSPYLSSADIVDETILTIKAVRLDDDQTKKTKDKFNTAYFVEKNIRQGEPLKPMILNAGNSKMLRKITGSPFLEDWAGTKIAVYVDDKVRFGKETVEGLRIRPAPKGPDPMEEQCLADYKAAMGNIGTVEELERWRELKKDDINASLTGNNLVALKKYYDGVMAGLKAAGA